MGLGRCTAGLPPWIHQHRSERLPRFGPEEIFRPQNVSEPLVESTSALARTGPRQRLCDDVVGDSLSALHATTARAIRRSREWVPMIDAALLSAAFQSGNPPGVMYASHDVRTEVRAAKSCRERLCLRRRARAAHPFDQGSVVGQRQRPAHLQCRAAGLLRAVRPGQLCLAACVDWPARRRDRVCPGPHVLPISPRR